MRKLRRAFAGSILAFAASTVFLGLFQNCAPLGFDKIGEQKPANAEVSGNGDIYSGFLFVDRLTDSLCSDGSDIRALIHVVGPQEAILRRDECQDIVPRTLGSDEVQISNGVVQYRDRIFSPAPAPVPPPTDAVPFRATYQCKPLSGILTSSEPSCVAQPVGLSLMVERTTPTLLASTIGVLQCPIGVRTDVTSRLLVTESQVPGSRVFNYDSAPSAPNPAMRVNQLRLSVDAATGRGSVQMMVTDATRGMITIAYEVACAGQ